MNATKETSAQRSIASGASISFGAQITSYGVGLIASILISRALGPGGRGAYYLPVTAAIACAGIMHLGLELANTYLFAERRVPLRRLMANASMTALLISPVCLLILGGFFTATRESIFSGVTPLAFWLAAITVPLQLHLVWLANLFALSGRVAQTQLIGAGVVLIQTLIAAGLYVVNSLTVTSVLCLYAGAITATWLTHLYLARRFAPPSPRLDRQLMRQALALGVRLQIGFIFWFLLLRSDVFLVKLELGTREVGIYSLAVIFAEVAMLLTTPLVVAALPAQTQTSGEDAGAVTFKVVRFNLALALFLSLCLVAILWLVIPTLYGAGFREAYPAFCGLVPGVVAMAAFRPLYNWLLRRRRPWLMSAVTFSAFALNVVLNLLLLPAVGIIGASLASSAAYVLLTAAFLYWARSVSGLTMRGALAYRRDDLESMRRFISDARARLAER